jgi:hypothetical protein
MSRDSSMMSLVVPGTGVTMAASRCADEYHCKNNLKDRNVESCLGN